MRIVYHFSRIRITAATALSWLKFSGHGVTVEPSLAFMPLTPMGTFVQAVGGDEVAVTCFVKGPDDLQAAEHSW